MRSTNNETSGTTKSHHRMRSEDDFIMTGVNNPEDYKSPERGNDIYLIDGRKEDLIFIANAKQDILKLISEIRKLKNT